MMTRKNLPVFLLLVLVCFFVNGFSPETIYAKGEYTAIRQLSDLRGKKVAIIIGTNFADLLEANNTVKGTLIFEYYNALPDLVQALKTEKVSAVPLDRPLATIFCKKDPDLTILNEHLNSSSFGMGFPKGSPYRQKFNQALAKLKTDGTLAKLEEKWLGSDEIAKQPIEQNWEAPNGTLRFWTEPVNVPMAYIGKDNTIMGYDVDLILHAAKLMGYRVEIVTCNFDGLIPALISGRADIIGSSIAITKERQQSIDFSDPYYESDMAIVVRRPEPAVAEKSFSASLKDSFFVTFIKDDRWKMFASGIATTLVITLLSAAFGTITGFAIFLLSKTKGKAATGFFEFLFSILERMPIIVTLMVFYYVIFGSLELNGIIVAIIVFSLAIASAMYGMLKTGVGAVPVGQWEAAYALGYDRTATFFKVILPQAARIILPSYKSELISLIKGTAVVGYIAVQDLTRMGDLIRSRTYEAFFPLITTALIYVVLTMALTWFLDKIDTRIDPKKRPKEIILKGVQVK